jgi:hypothetical protein
MKRFSRLLSLFAVVFLMALSSTGCVDKTARRGVAKRAEETRDIARVLNVTNRWANGVHDGLCYLEGQLLAAGIDGLVLSDAERYCRPEGPEHPPPPDPDEDPWPVFCDEEGQPEGCWENPT